MLDTCQGRQALAVAPESHETMTAAANAHAKRALVWFRRDLRIHDNHALHRALTESTSVATCYIIDEAIISRADTGGKRMAILLESLEELRRRLRKHDSDIIVRRGRAAEVLRLCHEIGASRLYFNEDYEPFARKRDAAVAREAQQNGIECTVCFDHLLTRPGDVLSASGTPYTVYAPFAKAARNLLAASPPRSFDTTRSLHALARRNKLPPAGEIPTPAQLGIAASSAHPPSGEEAARQRLMTFTSANGALDSYHRRRDLVDQDGTSRLSHALKLGMISARSCYVAALKAAAADAACVTAANKWIAELLWRDYYYHILWHFPHVADGAFDRRFDEAPWRDDEAQLRAWHDGETGYPIVDASMRQLRRTGWMHNRLRMIVAMFLTKDLLLHWQLGERVFMRELADGDLASNNGGWQWCASTGSDSAPYFRIFNPVLQAKKCDPNGDYVRCQIPELSRIPTRYIHDPWAAPEGILETANVRLGRDYPKPIVDHAEARLRAIAVYERIARNRPARQGQRA